MYGLPQIIIISNKLFKNGFKMWLLQVNAHHRSVLPPIQVHHFYPGFLIDFEYIGDHNYLHLLDVLEKYYTIETNFTGSIYCWSCGTDHGQTLAIEANDSWHGPRNHVSSTTKLSGDLAEPINLERIYYHYYCSSSVSSLSRILTMIGVEVRWLLGSVWKSKGILLI